MQRKGQYCSLVVWHKWRCERNGEEICKHCQVQKPSQHKEPLISTPLPDNPWSRVGADLLDFNGNSYLAAIYLQIAYMSETSSAATIAKLKSMFARWGIPDELMSDNGPQFFSGSFKAFAENYGFRHITSSPHYPQSNGMSEAAVKIAKHILKQEDPFLALMIYRATPVKSTGYSPAEIMMNRQIRTTLPSLPRSANAERYDPVVVKERDAASKLKAEYFFNRRHSASPLPTLQPGDTVRIKTDKEKEWSDEATVVGEAESPRSFRVQTSKGILRRNRRHLMAVPGTEDMTGPQEETSPPETQVQERSIPPSEGVRTRSGRLVKPPDRLDIK